QLFTPDAFVHAMPPSFVTEPLPVVMKFDPPKVISPSRRAAMLFVFVTLSVPVGNTGASPETGTTPPTQFAPLFQKPFPPAPIQTRVAAGADAPASNSSAVMAEIRSIRPERMN